MEEKWLGGGGLKRKRSFATAMAMACRRRGKRLDGELRLGFKREAGVLHDADDTGGAQGRGVASWPCKHARDARDAAWPSGPAASRGRVPGRDVRRPGCAEPPRRAWSRATSAKRSYAGPSCARDVASACGSHVRALGATTTTLASVSISRAHFRNCKTLKVSTKSKISKHRSCRGITHKLSQRATYVLVKGLKGKT
jgi:hypothetical protein